MRLINASTLGNAEFVGDKIPPYAIVSHTWGDEEISFEDLSKPIDDQKHKEGYVKMQYSCGQAVKDGIEWVWLDT
jgi:hypothetical protein